MRYLFACLCAAWLSACASVPDILMPEEEHSSYGTFIAARYAAITREPDTSAAFYADVLDAEPDVAFVSQRAFQTQLLAGDFRRADRSAVLAAEDEDGNLARLYLRAASLNDFRGYEDADPNSAAGAFTRVMNEILDDWRAVKDGEGVSARANLRMGVPENAIPYVLVHKAMMFEAAELHGQAEATWNAAVQTGELEDFITSEYGAFLERRGRRADAVALYQTRLDASDNDDPVIEQALERAQTGRRTPRRLRANQGAARSLYALSTILVESAPPDYVALYLRVVERMDPDFHRAQFLMAGSFEAIGMFSEALSAYDAIASGPYGLSAQVEAAWLQFQMGETENALLRAEALRDENLSAEPLLLIADIHRLSDRCDEAVELYNAVLADLPVEQRSWEAFYHSGLCHEELNDWPEAERLFILALEMSPDEPRILNHLGYNWIDRDINVDGGFELVMRAAELAPNNGAILDSVGWGHFKQGDYDQAVRWLEDAVARSPADPTINWHLGDAYARSGRDLLAEFQWRKALEFEPEAREVALIEERLSSGLDNATPDLE